MLCEADDDNNMVYTLYYTCVCVRARARVSPFLIHNWTVATGFDDAGRKIEFNCEILYKP